MNTDDYKRAALLKDNYYGNLADAERNWLEGVLFLIDSGKSNADLYMMMFDERGEPKGSFNDRMKYFCLNSKFQDAPAIITDTYRVTPAQVSSTTIGYRSSPLTGAIAPDAIFAGGTIDLLLVTQNVAGDPADDSFTVRNVGGAPFPDIGTNDIVVSTGVEQGGKAVVCVWDTFDRYIGTSDNIYAKASANIGLPTGIRLIADPLVAGVPIVHPYNSTYTLNDIVKEYWRIRTTL